MVAQRRTHAAGFLALEVAAILRGGVVEREIVDVDDVVGEQQGAGHHVLELAHVASPGVLQATDDVVAAQIKADWESTKNELHHLEAEIEKAVGDEKAKLQAKRDELRTTQAAKREKLQARVRKLQESWDAKIASMREKAQKAEAAAEARHAQHAQKLSQFAATQKQAFHDLFA